MLCGSAVPVSTMVLPGLLVKIRYLLARHQKPWHKCCRSNQYYAMRVFAMLSRKSIEVQYINRGFLTSRRHVRLSVCVCVCVCVRESESESEREREREREWEWEWERERERDHLWFLRKSFTDTLCSMMGKRSIWVMWLGGSVMQSTSGMLGKAKTSD